MRVTRRGALIGATLATTTGIASWRLGVAGDGDGEPTTPPRTTRRARPLRGANTSSLATEADIRALAATGGNLVRVMCASAPLRRLDPPYEIDEASFSHLDRVIAHCRKYRLTVVVDPHAFPGMQSKWTCSPDDALWQQRDLQDLAVELWADIAQRYKDTDHTILGYDLLNEPAVPDVTASHGLASWNALATRMAGAVRTHDARRHLIIEPAVGWDAHGAWVNRFSAIKYLLPPPDGRIVVSPHMYAPHEFTMQGIDGKQTGYDYPGVADGQYWDRTALARHMTPALIYQQTHGVPILVGEFSAPRWTGVAGIRYLRDNIDLFESWGWGWSYLAWRQFEGWDAELNDNPADTRRHDSTARLDLLKRYFARNHSPTDGF